MTKFETAVSIFYDTGNGYNETQKVNFLIKQGSLYEKKAIIPDKSEIIRIRVDLGNIIDNEILIRRLKFYQNHDTLVWQNEEIIDFFIFNQWLSFEVIAKGILCRVLPIQSKGVDPYFYLSPVYTLPTLKEKFNSSVNLEIATMRNSIFSVYLSEESEFSFPYNEDKKLNKFVYCSNDYQQVKIFYHDSIDLRRLRIDLGNDAQNVIKLKSIRVHSVLDGEKVWDFKEIYASFLVQDLRRELGGSCLTLHPVSNSTGYTDPKLFSSQNIEYRSEFLVQQMKNILLFIVSALLLFFVNNYWKTPNL
jgi:hypothetical protein